jgi:integrase/recombinase XerD
VKPSASASRRRAARGGHDPGLPVSQKNTGQAHAKSRQPRKPESRKLPVVEVVESKRRIKTVTSAELVVVKAPRRAAAKAVPPERAKPVLQPVAAKPGAKPASKAGKAGTFIYRGKTGKPAPAGSAARPAAAIKVPKTPARLQEVRPPALPVQGMSLHDGSGARKYLTADERATFLRMAEQADRQVRTLCMTLVYAGCRLSEALALTIDRVDLGAGVLVFESLKKRRSGIYRAVPVPPALLEALNLVHGIREQQSARGKGGASQGSAGGGRGIRLWPWSRMTGWRAIHAIMEDARLSGPHASPKGLRHGFGVAAVSAGIPLNLVQKWLGHAQLSTTAIYANAIGAEEQDIARRMWG